MCIWNIIVLFLAENFCNYIQTKIRASVEIFIEDIKSVEYIHDQPKSVSHYTSQKAKYGGLFLSTEQLNNLVIFLALWLKVICKYLALYFDLWSKLYYICLTFTTSENITLRQQNITPKAYHLPLGKYSCGVTINPYRYATKRWGFSFFSLSSFSHV